MNSRHSGCGLPPMRWGGLRAALFLTALLFGAGSMWSVADPAAPAGRLDSRALEFRLAPSGAYEILDRRGQVTWRSNPVHDRFGLVTCAANGEQRTVDLAQPEVVRAGSTLRAVFRPVPDQADATLTVSISLVDGGSALGFSYSADPRLGIESVRLLDDAFGVSEHEGGHMLVPVREGLLIPSDTGLAFTQNFDTYAYEGCHLTMLGVGKRGAMVLVDWEDPYVAAEVKSVLPSENPALNTQTLFASLVLRQSAQSFRVRFLGAADHVALARAYQQVARERGWVVPWAEKLKRHPERARLFGAINFKLWSALDRQMDEASTREERSHVNWTFAEAGAVAAHLKHDLELERVLFLMGGWIHRGYDNQHPDILPAAPECGGNDGLAECARRVRELGYLFGLHDNYQDMYRDAPSWNEDYLMRNADGTVVRGGRWAGGRAYLTCSQKAIELARRDQNLPAVKRLTCADVYFIDTTYAAGLFECHDPRHPLKRGDDLRWKQEISDYARGLFGIFGSECGREWALPHSDFFEGLTGVSGGYYHNADLLKKTGGRVVPLFELVYRDGIALYGKYGYDIRRAGEYVLHHVAIGRPLNHHNVPPHLYWQNWTPPANELAVEPCRPELEELDEIEPRAVRLSYQWIVRETPKRDWRVFVHFTDSDGKQYQENDHAPRVPTSKWLPGRIESAAFTIRLSERLRGALDVRVGLWDPATGERARLHGSHDGSHRYVVGRLWLGEERVELLPPVYRASDADAEAFVRGDNGWTAGLHPFDRFVKNTYKILSPLNALTSRAPMTGHAFLTQDGLVQRSVFGQGRTAVTVIANFGAAEFAAESELGGKVRLPRYGFLVESRDFITFHALSWNGIDYDGPVLFTMRGESGRALARAPGVRVYHGFGDSRLRWRDTLFEIEKERVVGNLGRD
ncbi:MAG: hypothetical protein KA191_01555 [Verrucomicrobia bacterium]|nr:hypothetical protein [Verrucomicrobiota bacterium]MDI9382020.1 glycoside hydrolase [Verrucomicrobiota bacterium]HNV00238.1 glycoside hydrolase [Verrucomicrobiota bacterium]HOA60368.1 glycoside hydrolase [Verrucomicrobiota bacterium]HOF46900.1 glycoside hydrolase [Verrucomicrobiota bacterium]